MYKTASDIADIVLAKIAQGDPDFTDEASYEKFINTPGRDPNADMIYRDRSTGAGFRISKPHLERWLRDQGIVPPANNAAQPQTTPANAMRDRWIATQEDAGRSFQDMTPDEQIYYEAMLGVDAEPPQPQVPEQTSQAPGPQQGQRMYNPPPGQERQGLARQNYTGQGPTPRAEYAEQGPGLLRGRR